VDLFDCVLPTRHGRHGTVLTDGGRLNLRNSRFAADEQPLDPHCQCRVCQRWSRAYLRHLLSVREPTGPRLVTVHNLAWTLRFVDAMRWAIREGRFGAFRQATVDIWG
jgi:queuine tRNA-ribosyltransferase